MPGFWARVCGIRETSLGKRRERKGCGNPVSLGGEANEGGAANKASIMRVGRHHAAAVLLSSHWLTTSPNPLAPHTFTLTHTHNQALEIPRIPSTSLTALWPRGDNKGMGRRWMPACSLDTEALFSPLIEAAGQRTLSCPSHTQISDCSANEMERTVHLSKTLAWLTC